IEIVLTRALTKRPQFLPGGGRFSGPRVGGSRTRIDGGLTTARGRGIGWARRVAACRLPAGRCSTGNRMTGQGCEGFGTPGQGFGHAGERVIGGDVLGHEGRQRGDGESTPLARCAIHYGTE